MLFYKLYWFKNVISEILIILFTHIFPFFFFFPRGCLGEVTFKEEENPKFDPYDEKTSYYDNSFKTINIMLPYVTEDNKSVLLISDHIKVKNFIFCNFM